MDENKAPSMLPVLSATTSSTGQLLGGVQRLISWKYSMRMSPKFRLLEPKITLVNLLRSSKVSRLGITEPKVEFNRELSPLIAGNMVR